MSSENTEHFNTLKAAVERVYKDAHPDCSLPIRLWKGKEIARFQAHLEEKASARISEKSFYTYFKQETDKIPRADILDILSQYTNAKNWQDFVFKNKVSATPTPKVEVQKTATPKVASIKKQPAIFKWKIPVAVASMLVSGFLLLSAIASSEKEYTFCFENSDFETPITDHQLEVLLLHKEESPKLIKVEAGCFIHKSQEKTIRFAVHGAYYKSDTITRRLSPNSTKEIIQLKRDDYAWMIHLISKNKLDDWKKRRQQLEQMIANQAEIFQVDEQGNGMELYNKTQFVNKLTLPIESLKNIEILESVYKNNQIVYLRFKQL